MAGQIGRTAGTMAVGLSLGFAMTGACSGAGSSGGIGASSGSGGGAASSGFGGSGNSGGGIVIPDSGSDAFDPDAGCDLQVFEAKLEKKPVDVIFVLDNSCSMTDEIVAIENNINNNFATIIANANVDYRVIFVGEQGPSADESICIGPPLGGTNCPIGANQPPVNNPPLFFHYDNNDISSHDSLCKLIDWYDKPDRYNLAPTGWREWLRSDSFKAFVEITDDGISCSRGQWSYSDSDSVLGGDTAAKQFDTDLLARDPAMFGNANDRNYIWYSIVGVGPNPASPDKSYAPTDPVTTSKCSSAPAPGTGYQWLSNMTGGLKFPVCEGQGFDVVFNAIAQGVIKGATIACEFDMPQPPQGKTLDLNSLVVEFTPQGGQPQKFTKVDNAAACAPGSFYIENDKIKLCPNTCSTVQGNDNAKLQILAFCTGSVPF